MEPTSTQSAMLIEKLCEYLDQESEYRYTVRRSPNTNDYTVRICKYNGTSIVGIQHYTSYTGVIYGLCQEVVMYTQPPVHVLH